MQLHGKQIKNKTITQDKLNIIDEFNLEGVIVTNLGSPENPSDAANKQYVDAIAQGLLPKDSCKVATTSSDNLNPWTYNEGIEDDYWYLTGTIQDIDDETLFNGDRILIKDADDKRGNGIWVYDTGDNRLYRAPDANNIISSSPVIENSEVRPGMFTFITKGTVNKTSGWVLKETTSIPTELSIDELKFAQFSGAGQIIPGDAIEIDGTEISVKFDDETIGLNAIGDLEVKDNSITPEKLSINLEGNGLSIQGTPNQLNVLVDDSTIEINQNNKLQVPDGGIDSDQIVENAITNDKIADGTIEKEKLAFDVADDLDGAALEYLGTPAKLNVKVDDNTIEIFDDKLQLKNGGIINDKIADGTIEKEKLAFDVAGTDLDGEGLNYSGTPGKLNVNVDDDTIEIFDDILRIKDGAISENKLQDFSVTSNKIANESIDGEKINTDLIGSGLLLEGTPKTLSINVDDTTIGINDTTEELEIKENGIGTIHISDNAITVEKLDISSIFGDSFESSGSPEQVNIKYADNSIDVTSEGIKAATLFRARVDGSNIDKNATGATNYTVSVVPVITSDISVYVNGLLEEFRWDDDSGTFCFKSPGGDTTRDKGEVGEGDVLYYRGINYALKTSDKIDVVYSAIQE